MEGNWAASFRENIFAVEEVCFWMVAGLRMGFFAVCGLDTDFFGGPARLKLDTIPPFVRCAQDALRCEPEWLAWMDSAIGCLVRR